MSPAPEVAKPRILVIDDEPGMTQLLGRILRSGYAVTQESEPRKAVARVVAGERFDLVLCDLMMAPIGGLEVYEGIAEAAPEMASRFLLMTGGTTSYELERKVSSWRHGVLYKPFNVADVLALVSSKLERLRGETLAIASTAR
jgi:DNA-binding NtrC family response regulator